MQLFDDVKYLAACVAGAFAGLIVNKSQDSTRRKASEAFAGFLAAMFWGPSIAKAAGVSEVADIMALGFGVALCGYGLITAIVDWAKGATVREWLSRFIGQPRPPAP